MAANRTSGNPTVRDEREASQKRGLWANYDPTAQIERVRDENSCPTVKRAVILSDPGRYETFRREGAAVNEAASHQISGITGSFAPDYAISPL